jgi:PEP-CTERM motif
MSVTRIFWGIAILAVCLFGFARASMATDIIYTDNFDGTGAILNGRAPDTATGADGGSASGTWTSSATTATIPDALWTASGGTYSGTGTTNASVGTFTTGADANLITNAYLPFTPFAGTIYDFHLAVAPSGVGASGNWLGMAFVGNNGSGVFNNGQPPGGGSSALSNGATAGLIILKGSGVVQSFGGTVNGSGQITSSTGNAGLNSGLITPGTSTPVYTNVDLDLNTTGSQWVVSWTLTTNPGNGSIAGGTGSFTYPVGDNPTTISGVILGTNKLTGLVSDMSLTSLNTVPEPSTLVLAGLSLIGLVGIARRKK